MTDYRYPHIAALRLEGKTSTQIAEHFGLSRNTVVGRLVRMGLMGTGLSRVSSKNKPKRKLNPSRVVGDWDIKTFEPYAARKARLAMEKANDRA